MVNEAFATNPANVKPSFLMVFRQDLPAIITIGVLISLIFVPLGLFVWNWLWLGMLLIPAFVVLVYGGTRRLLRLGACCPAKVVSLDPPRLAIYSDMTMRLDAFHPAITVKEFNSKGLSGGPVQIGDNLVVAAFYEPGDEAMPNERWKGLSATATIRGVTSNAHDIQRTFESVEADEWERLEEGARLVRPPFEECVIFLQGDAKAGGQGATEGRVFVTSGDDPDMKKAQALSRKTFRFFLRELSWEKRRIVPGLDIAAVKVAFSDPPEMRSQIPGELDVEYMWLSEVEFDGRKLRGVLLNEPDSLQSVHEGDHVEVNPNKIVDWLYSVMGEVCGGFTIQAMRNKMDKRELKQHDKAWGMDFCETGVMRLVPDSYLPEDVQKKRTNVPDVPNMFIQGDYKVIDSLEHPMSVNTREMLEESLAGDPSFLQMTDESGLPLIHTLTIAGSLDGVDVCLNHGADPNQTAENGMTPAKLAKGLGWKKVLARLEQAGATSS